MANNDGTEDTGNIDFGFDDGGLDLNFGDATDEPADLSAEDMAAGTEPPAIVTDLSGAAPAKAPVTAPAKETPPTPATPEQKVAPAAPAQPPAAQAQQPATEQQPGATAPQPTVDIEEFVAQNSEAIISNLAASHFAITDKEAEDLGFAPEVREWIQRREAKNFVLTMTQVNRALQQTLPVVVSNLVNLTNNVQTTHKEFYGEFPELQKEEYVPHMKQLAVMLRGMHPQMPKKEFQTLLGTESMRLFKIQRAAPATQQGGRTIRRGQAQPFTPAGAITPQRNHGGAGAEQLSGLDFMNAQLRANLDE